MYFLLSILVAKSEQISQVSYLTVNSGLSWQELVFRNTAMMRDIKDLIIAQILPVLVDTMGPFHELKILHSKRTMTRKQMKLCSRSQEGFSRGKCRGFSKVNDPFLKNFILVKCERQNFQELVVSWS